MAARKNAKNAAGSNAAEKLIQGITNRYRVTAREARDIVTAVSTATKYRKNENQGSYNMLKGDVVKQVKEAGMAAATGKKGTRAYVKDSGTLTRKPKK